MLFKSIKPKIVKENEIKIKKKKLIIFRDILRIEGNRTFAPLALQDA